MTALDSTLASITPELNWVNFSIQFNCDLPLQSDWLIYWRCLVISSGNVTLEQLHIYSYQSGKQKVSILVWRHHILISKSNLILLKAHLMADWSHFGPTHASSFCISIHTPDWGRLAFNRGSWRISNRLAHYHFTMKSLHYLVMNTDLDRRYKASTLFSNQRGAPSGVFFFKLFQWSK